MAWLSAMAKTRNGTRIDSGSMPKPSRLSRPICQTTAQAEVISGRMVRTIDCEKYQSRTAEMTIATLKKTSTPRAPSVMSPMTLAKPMMCTPMSADWYLARSFSSSAAATRA